MPGSEKQNSMFGPSSGYIQKNNPFPVTSCGRRRSDDSPIKCWKGYKRKPGTKKYAKGSCIKK